MNYFYLINRNYIEWENMIKDLEEISGEMNLLFSKQLHKDFAEVTLSSTQGDHYFEVFLYNMNDFTSTRRQDNFKKGYGKIGKIGFDFEDPSLFNFLKLLFVKYPDLLIYYEEGHASFRNPNIYSLRDLDKNDSLLMFTREQLK
ncbi:MAG: hypothetical protein NTW29_15440 [Bacteroidetes bacterium]|nr:hypothetical protein [Bacteroidota bacterium]